MSNVSNFLDVSRPDELSAALDLLNTVRRERLDYFPSPIDWRDEVLYFLLPDRFSDGKEGERELLTRQEIRDLRAAPGRPDWNWKNWADSGLRWQGGKIRGIHSQLDYLRNLGITAIWVGPIFKQRVRLDTYHGYGIQDFLEVDARFGSRQDLFDLVAAAHDRGMRIILDIIMNHSGDNWGYLEPQQDLDAARNEPRFLPWPNFYGNPQDDELSQWQLAWRNEQQRGFTTTAADINQIHEGVWPREFQNPARYTRAGHGNLGRGAVDDPHAEHKRTDFFALKDFALDVRPTLSFLADCFKYWIAITDCDGFRIDTVKHVSLEEARNFCGAIREFADSLDKRNFLLVGEIAGGDVFQDFYLDRLAILQRNLSAALDIGKARLDLQAVGKGLQRGSVYFNGFREDDPGFGSHRSLGDRHVSVLDDHDHVFGSKVRFSAEIPDDSPVKDYQIVAAAAMQLFTLGIPCLYYGTEQAFAGPAHSQIKFLLAEGWNNGQNHGDRYLREAMFSPEHPRAAHAHDLATQVNDADRSLPGFGPFGTAGKHCFDQNSPAFVRLAALCRTRAEYPVLRIGRQYPRPTRIPGTGFEFQHSGELIAWSRILDNQEAVCVVNPNGEAQRGGDVVVAAELWSPGTEFTVVANTSHAAAGGSFSGSHPVGSRITVKGRSDEREPAYIEVRDVQPAEVIVFVKKF
ncbi:MAG: alpha-amylase [Deltaproteobacteria bacterium]|nr:alpha-amylase [Deltaproteobacteria bacterium]